ncbi:MAG TPA: ABC transporter permease [Candidatus Binatia bacterium]|nr:ABC transporter permease [Candidatus Binatia bacterium]
MTSPGALLVLALVAVAMFAPALAPHSPVMQRLEAALAPPSRAYLLGGDEFGRDVLSRLIHGARISLGVAGLAIAISLVAGTAVGLVTGVRRDWLDAALMRLMDALLTVPSLVLALAVAAALGPGPGNAAIAIGLVYIPHFARLVRAQVLSLAEREFVGAARALGAGETRILIRHILPNVLPTVVVLASVNAGFAIMWEASLSFLGVGVQPPAPSWGAMLRTGYPYIEHAPWLAIAPGCAILVAVLGFMVLGDRLQRLLDPRLARTLSRGVA